MGTHDPSVSASSSRARRYPTTHGRVPGDTVPSGRGCHPGTRVVDPRRWWRRRTGGGCRKAWVDIRGTGATPGWVGVVDPSSLGDGYSRSSDPPTTYSRHHTPGVGGTSSRSTSSFPGYPHENGRRGHGCSSGRVPVVSSFFSSTRGAVNPVRPGTSPSRRYLPLFVSSTCHSLPTPHPRP